MRLINDAVGFGRMGEDGGNGGGSGGMSSNGGRRNGNVCQKVKDGMVKNGRNNAKCA